MSDPAKYRTREDVENVRESRDPIDRLQALLMQTHGLKEPYFEALDEGIKTEVNRVAEVSLSAARPSDDELFTDIYPNCEE